ncbi:MAG TPA: TonB-dependent receptor [Blastocatellia bacterium]|nr:TonB-dependent receptor [Blastocatellia bacterium]
MNGSMNIAWPVRLANSLILAILILTAEGRAAAQSQLPAPDLTETSLEELRKIEVRSVYSASKHLQKVTEAPSSVSIITADEIKKRGYRTLADILRGVRGFYVNYDRNYSYLGTRGFARPGDYNTRILLLVDGHRINDNIYGLAPIGTELPIEIDLIERIEIIRGPSSSLYGTSAFFATIDIITKQASQIKGVEASTEAASFGGYKERFSYGQKLDNGLELLLSASYYHSHGPRRLYIKEYDSLETNHGLTENTDDDRSKHFLINLSYRDFTLRGVYGAREKGIPTGAFATIFNDPHSRTIDRRGYLNLQYQHLFGNRLDLTASISYDLNSYDGSYVTGYADPEARQLTVNRDLSHGEWWRGSLQLSKALWRRHKFTLGTEYQDNLRQDQSNYDEGPYFPYIDDRRDSKNSAFYLQDELAIRENVTLSAGVRYDYYTTFGGTAKPRLGLIYHPAPKTSLKALYGEAFRAPSNFEFYYAAVQSYKPNPGLKPETIRTGELVLEQYLGESVRLSASGYLYRISGLISQQPDPEDGLLTYQNLESVKSKGIELEMETKLIRGIEGHLSYTMQDTRDSQTRQLLTNSPRHLGKFNLVVPLVKWRAFADLELQYTSRRKTLAGAAADAFWLSNLTLFGQKLVKGLDLSLSLYNLFDRKYGDPGAEEHRQDLIEQNGRNFRLKLTYRFNRGDQH